MEKPFPATFNVMIIAQSAPAIETIQHLLRDSGAATHAVSSSFDAILCSNLQQFDLVLCDCDLADPALPDALVSIRADARHADVPIIGMTRCLSDIDAVFAPARLSGWLAVPLDEAEFAAMLAKWQPHAAYPAPALAHSPDGAHAIPPQQLAVVQALGRLRGNGGLYRTMLRRFVEAYPATMAIFRGARAAPDRGPLTCAVHDLYALAGTIGANTLVATLASLKHAIIKGERAAFEAELATTEDQFRETLAVVLAYLQTTAA